MNKNHSYRRGMLYSSAIISLILLSGNVAVKASADELTTSNTNTSTTLQPENSGLQEPTSNEASSAVEGESELNKDENVASITTSTTSEVAGDNLVGANQENNIQASEESLALPNLSEEARAVSESDANFNQLLDNWNSIVSGNDVYDGTNKNMENLHNSLEKAVDKHVKEYNREADRTYLWEDKKDYTVSSNITATYRKIEDIAKQATNPNSKYYEDPTTISLVKDGLEFLYKTVYNEHTRYRQEVGKASVNWWDYEIGTPRALNNILSLLKSHFTQEEILKYTQPIEELVPDPTSFRKTSTNTAFPTFKAAVANMTDMGRVKLIAGLLRQDEKEIKDTIEAIASTAFKFVTEGNGFYEDGSLIDHAVTNPNSPLYNKGVAYNGSYGSVLIDGLSQLIPIIQKTNAPLPDETVDVIYQWIDKAFLPIIVHGELMDMTRGRSISRVTTEGHVAAVEALRGILRLSDIFDDERKMAIKTQVKSIVSEGQPFYDVYKNLKTYRDIKLMKDLLEDPAIPIVKRASYVKPYNSMDKLALYNANKDYGIGLSMFSDRTQNFESMNNENLRGWHTGDGMFYLYNGDLGHYSDNYWATVNPYKLPGTTETDAKRMDGTAANIKSNPQLVGMGALPDGAFVSSQKIDATTALAAMTFTNFNKTLTLNKGWLFLDGKAVFIGNDIQNTSKDKVATTIEQRKENPKHPYVAYANGNAVTLTATEKAYTDIRSIFLESDDVNHNIGYIFLTPTTLNLMKAVQTGKWSDIKGDEKSSAGTTELSNTFITISQEHLGNGDSYAYLVIPNLSRQEFEQMVANLDLELVQNNKQAIQIKDKGSQRLFTIDFTNQSFQVQSLANSIVSKNYQSQ